ncbi:unnamed protein product, partial [marine sediment metagenome]
AGGVSPNELVKVTIKIECTLNPLFYDRIPLKVFF